LKSTRRVRAQGEPWYYPDVGIYPKNQKADLTKQELKELVAIKRRNLGE